MHGASRRRRRRGRLLRLRATVQKPRRGEETKRAEQKDADVTVIGVWDDCVPTYLMPAYRHSAWLFWARQGGDRSVAKSAWIDRDATPMSDLEGLALSVLRSHLVPGCEEEVAGAEYWVQVRYGGGPGLGLHFDKDERAHAERDEWHHPMLATATYLTDGGAPLVVFDTASDGNGRVRRGWLVAPRMARHVAFLGNRLHGVPAELAPENLLASPINCAKDDPGTTRISVLVNLWDRKPVGVSRAAPYRGSTLPIDVSFARPVAPPIVVRPKDHHIRRLGDRNTHLIPGTENYAYLAEHRDGDTLPIPITRWIHSLAGGIPGHALELRSSD